jgi:membrane protein DedA with SNARE-associated domain/membrane-associated phospholipid phosphatase
MSAKQVIATVVAALLVAGVLWRRRQLGTERKVGALVLAAVLGIYASGVLPDLPDAKTVIGDVADTLGQWTYAVVGVFAFLETGAFVGLVAPGETIVIAGGVISGQGEISLLPLIAVVWASAVLGDTTSFFVGRRLGRGFLLRHGPRVKITEQRLEQVESYFDRHGGKTILIGRFIGLVRALAPFIAGSSGLAYRRFIPFSVVGTGLWGTLYCVLGYVFWQSFDRVAHVAGQATLAFAVVVGVGVGIFYAVRRLRDPQERHRLERWIERQGRKPVLRPLFAVARVVWRGALRPIWLVVGPEVRFVWDRITPGSLGLELTTALAVAGAGGFAFVAYAITFADNPAPTPLDSRTVDVVDHLHSPTAVDVVKVVTELGAAPTVGALIAIASIYLIVRRRPFELAALLIGAMGTYAGVQLAKAGVDRPRPSAPLVHTSQSSFPSGHTAYSTAWVAVAVALSRALPGLASRAGLVMAGVVVSAAVGASRIYLRTHFLSDVIGGWGLGAGMFGTCAVVALIVSFVRQNAMSRSRATESSSPARQR